MVKYPFRYKNYYIMRYNMRVAVILSFGKCLYLRGRLRLTTARRLFAYASSRALATTKTSSLFIVFTFLDSLKNKSGKPQPIWTNVGTHAQQVKGRQRSRNLGRDRLSGGDIGD